MNSNTQLSTSQIATDQQSKSQFDDIIKAKIDFINGAVDDDKSNLLLSTLIETKDINSSEQEKLKNELAFIDAIYQQDMPMEMPSSQLDERFYSMLNQASTLELTVENSAQSKANNKAEAKLPAESPTIFSTIKSLLSQLAPAPVWQAAALVTVFAVGYQTNDDAFNPMQHTQQLASNSQVEALNQQVSSLNALVAMSMINSDSASKRLAGIEYSAKVSAVDNDLNQALLQLLRADGSTSIRLSALNALANHGLKFGLSELSQQALLDCLENQRTMVQVNIIAVLVELGDSNTQQKLQALAANNGLNDDAKSFLTEAQNQAI